MGTVSPVRYKELEGSTDGTAGTQNDDPKAALVVRATPDRHHQEDSPQSRPKK